MGRDKERWTTLGPQISEKTSGFPEQVKFIPIGSPGICWIEAINNHVGPEKNGRAGHGDGNAERAAWKLFSRLCVLLTKTPTIYAFEKKSVTSLHSP